MILKFVKLLYLPYRYLVYLPFFFINTFLFGTLALVFSILINQRVGSFIGGVLWARLNSYLVPMFVSVTGKENIAKKTSYIVLCNHQSMFDIFLLYGWIGIDIKWVMKKELRKVPGLGFGSEKVGHIFLDRSNSRVALESLNNAKKKLVNGTSVVVFPEGTRSPTGEVGSFKRGAFKMATDFELPILPVTLINTRSVLPASSLSLFPGKVKMVIHEPIQVTDFQQNDMHELMDKVKNTIQSALPN